MPLETLAETGEGSPLTGDRGHPTCEFRGLAEASFGDTVKMQEQVARCIGSGAPGTRRHQGANAGHRIPEDLVEEAVQPVQG